MSDGGKIEIIKDAVIGFIVTVPTGANYPRGGWPRVEPIVFDWEGNVDTERVKTLEGERVAVLSPPVKIYVVHACYEDPDTCCWLGYEVEGAYHPDWEDIAREKLNNLLRFGKCY